MLCHALHSPTTLMWKIGLIYRFKILCVCVGGCCVYVSLCILFYMYFCLNILLLNSGNNNFDQAFKLLLAYTPDISHCWLKNESNQFYRFEMRFCAEVLCRSLVYMWKFRTTQYGCHTWMYCSKGGKIRLRCLLSRA